MADLIGTDVAAAVVLEPPGTMNLETARAELEALVRAKYPTATFIWGRHPEPGQWPTTWVASAHIPAGEDVELSAALAGRETDILIEHGISTSVVLLPDWPPRPKAARQGVPPAVTPPLR